MSQPDNTKDKLFAQPHSIIKDFVFDQSVVNVFDDMIQRSVPGYQAIVAMIGCLARQYVVQNTHVYDLGCSLGTVVREMCAQLQDLPCTVIGVDNSSAMIQQCRVKRSADHSKVNVEFMCEDIANIKFHPSSMVVMNFTLQFVDPLKRQELMAAIYDALVPQGILVLSEKIKFENHMENEFQTDLYHTFKKLNGYSDLEIAQKRSALERVLIPDSLNSHRQRLELAGFKSVMVWFQCFNFMSLVAHKV